MYRGIREGVGISSADDHSVAWRGRLDFRFQFRKNICPRPLCMKIESTPAPLPTLSSSFQDQEARTQSIVLAELIPYRPRPRARSHLCVPSIGTVPQSESVNYFISASFFSVITIVESFSSLPLNPLAEVK